MERMPDRWYPIGCFRVFGNLPRLSRPEFGTGFIAHRTIGQIGDGNRIPVGDELCAGPFAGIEAVAAPPHLARQTGLSGGRVGIHDPTVTRVENEVKGMAAGSSVKEDIGVHDAVPGIPLGLPQRLQSHPHA